MRKAGAIIALIAGIFGILAAITTLMVGGLGSVTEAKDAGTVVWLGWGGVLFSFLTIIFSSICLGTRSKWPGWLLIISAILGIGLGGTFVAIFMALALIGGIVIVMAKMRDKK